MLSKSMTKRISLQEGLPIDTLVEGGYALIGSNLITAERIRQKEVEGWTLEHDDQFEDRELASAAMCYAEPGINERSWNLARWPWSPEWWKPSSDPIRNLTKAGALIAAEIDRLIRKEKTE